MRALLVIGLAAASQACSLVFPVEDYDQGPSSGGEAAGGDGGGAAASGGGGAGGEPGCEGPFDNPPLSEITNDFSGGIGPDMALLNCATIVDGEVSISDLTGDYCWFYTVGARRLRCDAVTVRILEAGAQSPGVQRFVYVRSNTSDAGINILQEGGGFSSDAAVLEDTSFSLPQDTWWRISADENDVLTFETSPDGTSWAVRGSGPSPLPLDDVHVAIGAGNYGAIADPGVARFDCFNVEPPCP